jgi:MoxR-like ATPase
MTIAKLAEHSAAIIKSLGQVIVGKDHVLQQMLMGILTDGHILIEDYPGLAKTLMAHSFAQVMDIQFSRIQFTPDLLPGDITGSNIFNQKTAQFEFLRGPLFANLVLADEINRATPKTQSALLEAMQEQQITVEGKRFLLAPPFIVIATQNPIEFEGTYPLPEAQLDRFIMKIGIGYPSLAQEIEILDKRRERKSDVAVLRSVVDGPTLSEMQKCLEEIYVGPEVGRYMVELVQATRGNYQVQVGASPRGSLALFKLSRANAALGGRDFVTPEDVKAVCRIALSHRIILKPEFWVRGIKETGVIDEILDKVPTPKPVEKG